MSGTPRDSQQQLGLFHATLEDDPIRRRLRDLDVNQLTPLQALALLAELKEEARE